MPTYYTDTTASDLSPSWSNTTQFDIDYTTTVPGTSTENISLTESQVKSAGAIVESGRPNSDDWEDGGTWTIIVATSQNANMNIRGRCRATRLTSSGGVDQQGSFTGYQTFSSGSTNYTFSPVAPTWSTTEACTHRLAVEWEFENLDTMMSQDVVLVMGVESGSKYLSTDITEDAGTCTGGVTFVPKCVMF